MTKRIQQPTTLLFALLLLLLAACNSDTNEPDITPEATQPAALPTTDSGSYPAPDLMVSTPLPDAYPVNPIVPVVPETTSPYPGYPGAEGETIWIVRPLGQQCVDPTTYVYPDLATAAAALTSAGVTVLASEELALMVCEACDCPTSEHFRVLINSSDYGLAEPLGWTPEN
jgi:hypothetical protein